MLVPMTDLLRQEVATAADLVVVKVGTRVLTAAGGLLDRQRVASLGKSGSASVRGPLHTRARWRDRADIQVRTR